MHTDLPQHVAIIMDGNGRWAQARGYPRFYGHLRGSNRVKEIVRAANDLGIPALTLYAFSTENWKRPEAELGVLWRTLQKYLLRQFKEMKQKGVRLQAIGEIDRLPGEVQTVLKNAIEALKDGKGMLLTFALSYGGRSEIVAAAKSMAAACVEKRLTLDGVTEAEFEKHLQTRILGKYSDVDLLIRTSGEKRLSNYLLWQCSYAEFEFPEVYWPDYSVEEFRKSLENFKNRKRRFGAI